MYLNFMFTGFDQFFIELSCKNTHRNMMWKHTETDEYSIVEFYKKATLFMKKEKNTK